MKKAAGRVSTEMFLKAARVSMYPIADDLADRLEAVFMILTKDCQLKDDCDRDCWTCYDDEIRFYMKDIIKKRKGIK